MAFKILTPEERQNQQEEFERKRTEAREQRSNMLDDLIALESGLTHYEVGFVKDMSHPPRRYRGIDGHGCEGDQVS